MHQLYLWDFQNIADIKHSIRSLIEKDFIEFSFLYQSCFQNTKILRDISDFLCTEIGMSSKWKTRIVLIVDEMNNNAIEYGSKENDMNEFFVSIKRKSHSFDIHMFVCDAGTWEYAKSAQDMENIRKQKLSHSLDIHNSVRGRGLFMIILNLVDELYFLDWEKGGLKVGIKKELPFSED